MSTLKKTLSIILAVLMLVSSVPAAGLTAFAYEAEELIFVEEIAAEPVVPEGFHFTGRTELDENGNTIWEVVSEASEYGLINVIWIDVAGNEVQNPDYPLAYPLDENGEQVLKGDILPSSYDSRELGIITPVEYQVGGTCWAHAGMSVIETAYIKQGLGTALDLSEYHTAWFSKNGYCEDVTDSANDGYVAQNIVDDVLDSGGNMYNVERAMYNFAGGVLESKYPLRTENNDERVGTAELAEDMKETFTYETKYQQDIILESVKAISYDISALKQAVIDYGAVKVSYYSDDAYYNYKNGLYGWYIGEHQEDYQLAYYHPTMNSTNHAVTLVGWDDNFSRENFGTYKPERDGAWLIKNSWSEDWGNDGYFWISYEDKSIQQYDSYVVEVGDTSDYEDVYFYDGLGSKHWTTAYKTAANVFTAENDIYLTKIGHSASGKVSYGLQIYTGLPENCTDPTAGTLLLKQSGNTNGEKYIPVEGDVKISKGERFSVVLTMDRVYYEGTDTESAKYTCAPGDSFLVDGNSNWVDMSDTSYGNAGIRAIAKYQNDSGIYKVSYRDGSKFIQSSTSENGVVELPEKEGYTYIFSYNGEEFDGTGVTQDIIVTAHCYPTNGKVSETNGCITEFECIYCGEKMKPDVTAHSYESDVFEATTKNIGYTKNYCTVCGEYDYSNFNILEGAEGGQTDGYWWQFSNGCLSVAGEGILPDFANENSAPWKSYNNSIVEVNVIGEITRLGSFFFSNLRKMTTVTLPETVEEIGERCFYLSTSLEKFDCPENLLTLEKCAFMNSGFTEFNYNDKIYTIGLYAFMYCNNITEAVIPATAKNIVRFPFYGCSKLKKITVEEGITYVSDLIWSGTPLEELVLPSTVSDAFFANFDRIQKYTVAEDNPYYCSVDGVLFNKDMTSLKSYPATKTDKYYKIPDSVTEIDNYAFGHINGLKYLDMSECKVRTIWDRTFNQTKSLVNVNLPETLANISYQAFYKTRISSIYVPSTVTSYQNPPFTADGDSSYKVPDFYTDSEDAKIKEFADANGYSCTVLHTAHDFNTVMTDMGKDPTCKDEGTSLKTCVCGNFEYKTVPATGEHSLVKSATTDPTCTDDGYTVYTCSACGISVNKDIVGALGHSFSWVTDKEATCGATGLKHEKCIRCDETRSLNTVIDATGNHSYTSKVTTPATHLATGVTTFTCSGCSATYTETIAKLEGHTYSEEITAPTCEDKGYTTYTCACGDSYKDNYVDALGHDYKSEVTTAPTCEGKGVETFTCANCGDSYTKDIDAKGHNYSKEVTAPTCTDKGYTTYTCACGDTYVADYVDALGHAFTWITDKEATCGADGKKHEKCSRCDATQSLNTVIAATGNHSYSSEITTAATHLKEGVETFTCSGCGNSYTESIAKLEGHTYSEKVTAPTCTAQGYTTYTCACGDTYKSDYVDAKGHDYKSVVTTEPTCEDKGIETFTCANCGNSYTKDIAATGHNYSKEVTAPTCTDKGYTTYTCACGDTYKSDYVDAKGHDYKSVVTTAPTCTADGIRTFTCASCGDTYTETITATGHTLKSVDAKAPTCTADGYKAYEYCENCSYTTYEKVNATGHSYEKVVTAPTCDKEGYTTYTCACGDNYVGDKVAALGHTYGAWTQTKAPTCTAKGEEERACSACGNTEIRELATIDHVYTSKVTAPTCDKDGYTTYTCSVCGNGYTSDIVKAKGHAWGEWVVLKESTCTEKGAMECECANCGGKWFSEIAMANHIYKSTVVNPTCTEKGYTLYECKKCTDVQKDKFVDALGHSDADADTFCDACGAEMPAKECSCMCHQSGFMGFIYKIISFFWKLFKMNPVCECGVAHY